jgi:DNA-binding XRE family transcriptional regulator
MSQNPKTPGTGGAGSSGNGGGRPGTGPGRQDEPRTAPTPTTPTQPGAVHTRLRAIRCEIGLSQAALAKRLGVTRATMFRWENGYHPANASHLAQWADELGYELALIPIDVTSEAVTR